jgi:hypothetical protein
MGFTYFRQLATSLAAIVLISIANQSMASANSMKSATTRVLVIGFNGSPRGTELPPLNYADDDAIHIAQLWRDLGGDVTVLTELDQASQRRMPEVRGSTKQPTTAVLTAAVARLRHAIAGDRARGLQTHVMVFYSGHGQRRPDGRAELTLLDGPLTQQALYEDVISALPADYVHLFVDACYAEAVVRPRAVHAEVTEVTKQEADDFLLSHTLAQFPHVGAVVASTAGHETHEWEVYQGGVFTHQLISGLRGGADVNGDGRIEYSELFAFLTAANAGVPIPEVRLQVLARPPTVNPSVAIVHIGGLSTSARLVIPAGTVRGRAHVEDDTGRRLADLHPEPGSAITLVVPPDRTLFVRTHTSEAVTRVARGGVAVLRSSAFVPLAQRSRGAQSHALTRGLFALGFGRGFYQGLLTNPRQFVSVDFRGEEPTALAVSQASGPSAPSQSWLLFGAAAALGTSAITSGVLALSARNEYRRTELERPAAEAAARYRRHGTTAWVTGLVAAASLAGGVMTWRLARGQDATTTLSLSEGAMTAAVGTRF